MSRPVSRPALRWPVLLVIPAALVGGGLADRAGAPATPSMTASVQPAPLAAPVGAYSSSWFCAGAADSSSKSPAGAPPGIIDVENPTDRPETATVQIVTSSGSPVSQSVKVAAHATAAVAEHVSGGAAWSGAVVEVDGSSAVEEVLSGPLGRVVGQCATSGSKNWYLPTGQTRVNADEWVLLLNPFPTVPSIVDLSFTTDHGQEQPQEFESISVDPGQIVAVDLGLHLRRRSAIATSVKVRTGRVVAWSEEVVTKPTSSEAIVGTAAASTPLADPASPVPGVTLTLGAPSAGASWSWPDGLAGNGVDEQYLVYNPGVTPADVSLAIGLSEGSAEPFNLTVGPGQVVPVVSEQQARIPAGSPHTAVLTSTNGVPVVALRTVSANSIQAGLLGIGAIMGERLPASDWLVPLTGVDPHHRGQIVVANPGQNPVTVTFSGAVTKSVTVAPQSRAAVAVSSPGAVAISATGAVYAEYDLFGAATNPGYSLSPAIPLAGS